MENPLLEDLDMLFTFVTPDELRKSVNHVYFYYLVHTEILPEDYKKTAEDIYFLLHFLEKAQDLCKVEETNRLQASAQ